jgi:TPR repeat protein
MKMNLFPKPAAALLALSAALLSPLAAAASADPAEAVLLVSASPSIRADAQLAEGRAAYLRGDFERAFRVFRNIAVLGITEAHFMLGVMYRDGQGTRKSAKQAEYWFRHAAQQHHPGAAEALEALKLQT